MTPPDDPPDLEKAEPLPPEPLPDPESTLPHPPDSTMSDSSRSSSSKHPLKSKTVWGLLAFALGAVATMLGWPEGSFAFLADGLQMADVGAILAVLGYAWKEYGKRAATSALTTFSGDDRTS